MITPLILETMKKKRSEGQKDSKSKDQAKTAINGSLRHLNRLV